jgi:hypothetical protein
MLVKKTVYSSTIFIRPITNHHAKRVCVGIHIAKCRYLFAEIKFFSHLHFQRAFRLFDWPHQEQTIQPYLIECFPQMASDAPIRVQALAAERTFWEKALLLHEETFRPKDKPRKIRMARHYYDLWCLITRGVAEKAMQDRQLFERVAAHREIFFHWSWVDYSTLHPGALRLLPLEHQLEDWRKDYQAMSGAMFFGEVPSFDEILKVVGDFQNNFNANKPK